MRTAIAGTLESMDCMVTVKDAPLGAGLSITLEGTSVARFRSSMEKTVRCVAAAAALKDIVVHVQDRGALEITLEARIQAALSRLQSQENLERERGDD